ncbi:MAG: type I 3-dehydroquinate dehydratase [Burkholderiales bacterium]|nr:type I 3-dehydroquinate dehydratase [Burkholderiales bacterium]
MPNKHPEYPIIASASGNAGRITRLAGGLFGIDLTFASGVKGSNPWQIPVETVQEINNVIYPVPAKEAK